MARTSTTQKQDEWDVYLSNGTPNVGDELDCWFSFRRRGKVESVNFYNDTVTLRMKDKHLVVAKRGADARWHGDGPETVNESEKATARLGK